MPIEKGQSINMFNKLIYIFCYFIEDAVALNSFTGRLITIGSGIETWYDC